MTREPCPYCGQDAGTGPWAHATREGCVAALKAHHAAYRHILFHFVLNYVSEVKNDIGGVICYELHLNADETEQLLRLLE